MAGGVELSVSSLWIHPVKSCAPAPVHDALVEVRGLRNDRRWMVVAPDGRFLTGRQCPKLVLLRAVPEGLDVRLDAPGMTTLHVRRPSRDGARLGVAIWKDHVDALACAPQADAWLGEFLGRPVRLVYMDDAAVRGVDPHYGWAGDEVSFADGYPLLLVSQGSLDLLNTKLLVPVPMARFRPNIVVRGCAAHAEDGWRRITVGMVEFEVVKPCTRCVFTTVDTTRGEFDGGGEPLNTLKSYRRGERGVTFGQNLIPRTTGNIRVGDPVAVIE
jgi:uncharacterized protein